MTQASSFLAPGARRAVAGLGLAAVVIAAAAAAAAASQPSAPAPYADARMAHCGVPPGAKILASFDMASASAYRDHLPGLGDLPELDGVAVPAYVVVMNGPVAIPAMHPIGYVDQGPSKNAVCVLVDDVPNIYVDVDLSGLKP